MNGSILPIMTPFLRRSNGAGLARLAGLRRPSLRHVYSRTRGPLADLPQLATLDTRGTKVGRTSGGDGRAGCRGAAGSVGCRASWYDAR